MFMLNLHSCVAGIKVWSRPKLSANQTARKTNTMVSFFDWLKQKQSVESNISLSINVQINNVLTFKRFSIILELFSKLNMFFSR